MVAEAVSTTINVLATIANASIFFSMAPKYVVNVIREKSTDTADFYPLLAMFGQCAGWILYGWLSGAVFPLSTVNALGLVLAIIYWAVYLTYEKAQRKLFIVYIALDIVVAAGVAVYTIESREDRRDVARHMGYIANITAIILFATPLADLQHVMEKRCSDILSFGMALSGVLSGALWTTYGVIEGDNFVLIPNVINCGLCLVQLVFIFIYPRSGDDGEKTTLLGSKIDKYVGLP